MHELGITRNIVSAVSDAAGERQVSRVKLQIGELSAVMPDAIRFCFDVCAQGTVLEGAELEIEAIPGRGVCDDCENEMSLNYLAGVCECGSRNIRCIAGEELNIKEMEIS